MRRLLCLITALLLVPSLASAQEMNAAQRSEALGRVRTMAQCVERERAALQRLMRLIAESEQQRDHASDVRVRQDAERAIEALLARTADAQRGLRDCLRDDLPGRGPDVVVRDAAPDPAADHIAATGGTVRSVERDTQLTDLIHVVRGEQVDGQGRLDAEVVRRGMRNITNRLSRCYESYLRTGTAGAHQLNLVFTLRNGGQARQVSIERSGFGDARFERCVRTAGQRLRFREGPRNGEAIYSYTLRFGR